MEVSLEELERLEMEVHEDYNPSGELSDRAARRDFLQKLRLKEAEEFRVKFLSKKGSKEASNIVQSLQQSNHNASRASIQAHSKPRRQGRVTYIFEDLPGVADEPFEIVARSPEAQAEEDGSLSQIL